MIITVLNVSEPQKIKTYFTIEVNYKNEKGDTQGKKLMSFSAPSVYATMKEAQAGEQYDITVRKEGDYWNWVEAKKADGASKPVGSQSSSPAKSNYETTEERAKRQRLIVRQSSLTNAVAILTVGAKALKAEDVKVLANELTDWVFEEEKLVENKGSFDDFEDDIPH